MTVEKIIQRIKDDATKESKKIIKEVEQQAKELIKREKQDAEQEAQKILANGKAESDNTKKILISKANQNVKQNILTAKEKLIDECFQKAQQQLAKLNEKDYKDMITTLIKQGKDKLGSNCIIIPSRPIDKQIAQQHKLNVKGSVTASGGILIKNHDETITIDNTFEGILKRKKDELRIHIGKLLFST